MEFAYDVFISYSPSDEDWVRTELLPRLSSAALKIIFDQTFTPGVPIANNISQAVASSRFTLLIITPEWLHDKRTIYAAQLAEVADPTAQHGQIIPVHLRGGPLTEHQWLDRLTKVDLTGAHQEAQWERLLNHLRGAPNQVPAVPVVPSPPPREIVLNNTGTWEQVPGPEGWNICRLTAVWGSGPDDVWMVDNVGTILHWRGKSWSIEYTDTQSLCAIGGTGPQDVWFLGTHLLHWDGKSVHKMDLVLRSGSGLWCCDPGNVWIALTSEWDGLMHWDGQRLESIDGRTTGISSAHGVWGGGPNDIWAWAANVVFHWDGNTWSKALENPQIGGDSRRITGFFPLEPGRFCICIDNLTAGFLIVHLDGQQAVTKYVHPNPGAIFSIWGRGPKNIWAVGWDQQINKAGIKSTRGLTLHWDGTAWTDMPSNTREMLFGVWCSSNSDAWAVGDNGTILHL